MGFDRTAVRVFSPCRRVMAKITALTVTSAIAALIAVNTRQFICIDSTESCAKAQSRVHPLQNIAVSATLLLRLFRLGLFRFFGRLLLFCRSFFRFAC